LRRWAKWAGLALTIALAIAWVASSSCGYGRVTHARDRTLWNFAFISGYLCISGGVAGAPAWEVWSNDWHGLERWWTASPLCWFYPGDWAVILPLWIPLSLTLGYTLVLFWRDRRRIAPGHCRCGYDLTRNTSGVCPECGEQLAEPAAPKGDL
jgi:hypothetical protein